LSLLVDKNNLNVDQDQENSSSLVDMNEVVKALRRDMEGKGNAPAELYFRVYPFADGE